MSLKLVALATASLGISLALSYSALVATPEGLTLKTAEACGLPSRAALRTDVTGFRPADDFLCLIVPFFDKLLSSKAGVGFVSLFASMFAPLSVRMLYVVASPNHNTIFHSLIYPMLVCALGQLGGIGLFPAFIGVALYLAGLYSIVKDPAYLTRPPVPSTPASIYGANFANLGVFAIFGVLLLFDTATLVWFWTCVAFQVFPFFTILPFMLLAQPAIKKPKTDADARKQLLDLSVDEVAQDFLRTWANYRQIGLASMCLYWLAVHRLVTGLILDKEPLNDATHFMLNDCLGLFATLIVMRLAENLTIRSTAPVHPVLGTPRAAVDIEAEQAIAKAPAGNIALETQTVPMLLGLFVAGPGFTMALHWARGEEIAGWKSRRAWREAKGLTAAKKQ